MEIEVETVVASGEGEELTRRSKKELSGAINVSVY